MKRYKLIQDIKVPGLPFWSAGLPFSEPKTISTISRGHILTIGEWTKVFPWLIGSNLSALTDWFELVEEKEFTRSDMVNFALTVVRRSDLYPENDKHRMECNLNIWIKDNKS